MPQNLPFSAPIKNKMCNYIMKNQFLITAILIVGSSFLQSCGNSNHNTDKTEMESTTPDMTKKDAKASDKMQMDHKMMKSMNHSMDKMHDMKMTGDFDLDFANMMIVHHQAAIDMSEEEIAKGTVAQIKTMAGNIITAQKDEIAQLKLFTDNYKMPEAKPNLNEMHNQLSEAMKAMMVKMNNMQMSGNADKDYVMMMIPHHESAVTMAKDELTHGKHQGLKKMAQKMIDDQTREIGELKAWTSKQQ